MRARARRMEERRLTMGKDGHEELLGTPLEPGSHRQTVEDNLLGRPRVAEK